MPSRYTDLPNVACDIFCNILHGVGGQASFDLSQVDIGLGQSKTRWETIPKTSIATQFSQANNVTVAGDGPAFDIMKIELDLEMKNEADERKLHRMANVHNIIAMWQGTQNLHATQKVSRTQNMNLTAGGYISDTEEIVKAIWSIFEPDGAAGIILSEWSPLPPAFSANDIPGRWTEVLTVCPTRRINHHPAESDEDSAPASILVTRKLVDWNGDLDNPRESWDDWEADNEFDKEIDDGIEDPESPAQRDVSAALNVPGWFQPTRRSKKQPEEGLL